MHEVCAYRPLPAVVNHISKWGINLITCQTCADCTKEHEKTKRTRPLAKKKLNEFVGLALDTPHMQKIKNENWNERNWTAELAIQIWNYYYFRFAQLFLLFSVECECLDLCSASRKKERRRSEFHVYLFVAFIRFAHTRPGPGPVVGLITRTINSQPIYLRLTW